MLLKHLQTVFALRLAVLAAAVFGIASHAAMVLKIQSGPGAGEFVLNDIPLFVGWHGGAFTILGLGQFATRSRSGLIAILLLTVALALADRWMFADTNSKDWYVALAPLMLMPIAFVCWLVVLLLQPAVSKPPPPADSESG
jgi:hypothetical protein